MKVFIAGATGAVGRPLVAALIKAGHSVVGLSRTPAKAELIREMGAEPAIADGLDASAIAALLGSTRPNAVILEMTDLASATDLRHFDRTFAPSNQLRTKGTDFLLAAARETCVKRFIAQSYCGWPYARSGEAIKTEAEPLDPDPPAQMRDTLNAIQYLERTVTGSVLPEGIVLRYGAFYGPGTGILDRAVLAQIRNRRLPLIGNGAGWWSFVHVEDAAAATVKALEHGRAGSIYNIVDDDPAQVREWLPALADIVGAKRPLHLPVWIARLVAGEHLVSMMTQVRAGSNRKARAELDWQPAHPSWRAGFAEITRQSSAERTAA
jgi:nucleoside-diphosphate-sugar epimerase